MPAEVDAIREKSPGSTLTILHRHLEEPIREDLIKRLKISGLLVERRVIMGLGDETQPKVYVFADAWDSGSVVESSPVSVVTLGFTEKREEGHHFWEYTLPYIPCDDLFTIKYFSETKAEEWSGADFSGLSQLLKLLQESPDTWILSDQRAEGIMTIYEDPHPHLRSMNRRYFGTNLVSAFARRIEQLQTEPV